MSSESQRPQARQDGFLTEELDDELLVYDEQRHVACRLNRTAAAVWRNSDGERTVADLAAILRDEIGELADEDLVLVTLDQLVESGLIESGYERRDPDSVRLSRRRFIRRAGVVGTAALMLPVVASVAAPIATAAASPTHTPYCDIYEGCAYYYVGCYPETCSCYGCTDGHCYTCYGFCEESEVRRRGLRRR